MSIAMQNISDIIQVTIVDDNSSVDYKDLTNTFNKLLDIQYIKLQNNQGVGHARKVGFESTTCPYVTYIDSDDTLYNEYSLYLLYEKVINTKCEITVSSEIEDEDVINLLANHTTRLVAVTLENGVITQITAAENILKPTIEIQPEVSEIVYEHSKFSKKKFDLNLVIKCDVKYPYSLEQVLSAAGEDSGLAVQISKVTQDSQFADSGSIPYYLKDGIFDSKDVSYEKEPNLSLALGETQTISLTAYLKDDYIPENVSNATTFTAQLNDDATTRVNKTVNIANMDKAKKIAQTKQSVSANAPEMNKINTILNGTQAAFDDTKLREYLTDNEVKAVTAQVNNWIYTSNALNSIITDDSENGLIKQLLKKSNLSKEALADKVFEIGRAHV